MLAVACWVAQDVPRLLGRSEGIDGATHDIDNTKIAEEMVQNLDMNVRRPPLSQPCSSGLRRVFASQTARLPLLD